MSNASRPTITMAGRAVCLAGEGGANAGNGVAVFSATLALDGDRDEELSTRVGRAGESST
jgi:hypothetical protein